MCNKDIQTAFLNGEYSFTLNKVRTTDSKITVHEAITLEENKEVYDFVIRAISTYCATDVPDVTHCKDCWAYETAEYDDGYKKRFCHLFKRQMQEDDFCSYGEPCDCFEKHSIAKIDRRE